MVAGFSRRGSLRYLTVGIKEAGRWVEAWVSASIEPGERRTWPLGQQHVPATWRLLAPAGTEVHIKARTTGSGKTGHWHVTVPAAKELKA